MNGLLKHALITGGIIGTLTLIFPEFWITAVVIFCVAMLVEIVSIVLDRFFFGE